MAKRVKGCNHHDEESIGTCGNPCEGGTCYFRCNVCGKVRVSSEDGTEYYSKDFKPHITSIEEDMLRAGYKHPITDDMVMNFLGDSQYM